MYLRIILQDNEFDLNGDDAYVQDCFKELKDCIEKKSVYSSDSILVDGSSIVALILR